MSALELFSVDWLHGEIQTTLALHRPNAVVVFGTEQDWQFQAAEEERVVVGSAPKHGLGPAGAPGAPGPETVAPGQRVASIMTLHQGCSVAIRAVCETATPDSDRVRRSQERAFTILRWVLFAIDKASHGSNNLRLQGSVDLTSPETADYQHGALLRLSLQIDVPVYGPTREVAPIVESDPTGDEARTQARLEACDPTGTMCQVVMETE